MRQDRQGNGMKDRVTLSVQFPPPLTIAGKSADCFFGEKVRSVVLRVGTVRRARLTGTNVKVFGFGMILWVDGR